MRSPTGQLAWWRPSPRQLHPIPDSAGLPLPSDVPLQLSASQCPRMTISISPQLRPALDNNLPKVFGANRPGNAIDHATEVSEPEAGHQPMLLLLLLQQPWPWEHPRPPAIRIG